MYISINNIIYLLGTILSIYVLFSSRGNIPSFNIPSFFSRKRIIRLLRDENPDLDNALKKLHKWHYSDYDAFTVFPIITIFFVLGISGAIQFTIDVDQIIIIIVYSAFIFFYSVITWKLNSFYQKTVDEVTVLLRKIGDWIRMADASVVSSLAMVVFLSGGYIFNNQDLSGGLIQIIVLSVVVMLIIAFLIFLSAFTLRNIERNYVVMLNNEGKLPTLSVKIKLNGHEKQIVGDLLLLDYSKIVIQEADGYRLSFKYSTVETIGAKSNQKNEEMS